jgi:site-specific recombinase XerD
MKNINDFEMFPVLKDFISYMQNIKAKSQNTVQVYFYDLRVFFRFMKLHRNLADRNNEFENISIADIDLDFIRSINLSDLYAFLAFVSNNRDNSSYARARKVACLKSFFKYITLKAKLLDVNPAAELESPKILKRLPRYLNVEESKQLLNSIDGQFSERDYAIIVLFLNCGLRLSELVGINISKIKEDTLTVIGKGNKERTVYLNSACIKAINNYLTVKAKDGINEKDKDALFLSERNNRINKRTVELLVGKYVRQAGLFNDKYTPHKLRHTAATLMYKYGNVDIRALQQILGHESVSTTQIYTHIDDERLREAIKSNPLSEE